MSGEALAQAQPRNGIGPVEIDPALLKTPIVLCIGDIVAGLRQSVPRAIKVWRVAEIAPASITVEIADHQLRTLAVPPLMVVAVIAAEKSDVAMADSCAAWLRDHGARSAPDVVVAASKSAAELAAGLAGSLLDTVAAQAELITTLARELSSARITNEALQNHFSAAEAVLARKGLQPYDIDFVNEPADGSANVLRDAIQGRITQVLPVGSAGVSAVGIHLAADPKRNLAGVLKAQITALEDGLVIDTWSVPLSGLRSGWNVFGFERSLAGLPRTLELTIAVTGDDAEPPSLSLGGPQPLERFRVHDADSHEALADASLALQVWTGLAGVALPYWATYWSSGPRQGKGTDTPLRQESVPPDILNFVSHHNTDEVEFTFEAVQALVPERAIACHPPISGTTIARLPGACPAGALRVSAYALLDNEKSKDVEFALVTTADTTRARLLLSGEPTPTAGESVSDWVRVSPGAKKAVNAFIRQPITRWQDIFVATRMAEPGNNDFAWAKFQDLTIVFQDMA
ncbi:MAG: DUF6212 domain-containing protein [Alphaproteobacteria bacterium]